MTVKHRKGEMKRKLHSYEHGWRVRRPASRARVPIPTLLALLPLLAYGCDRPRSGPPSSTEMAAAVAICSDPFGLGDPSAPALDHVVLVVADLTAAVRTFTTQLGFSAKPGRPHDNGLANAHLKFQDGTEIELMTVSEDPGDATARAYHDFLQGGEGGGMLAFAGGPVSEIDRWLTEHGTPHAVVRQPAFDWVTFAPETGLDWMFFIDQKSDPGDLPEHLAHANGAMGVEGVRVRGQSFDAEREILAGLGAAPCGTVSRDGRSGIELAMGRGRLALFDGGGGRQGRPLVMGVTLRVRTIEPAAALASTLLGYQVRVQTSPRGQFVRIPPARAHGIEIDFLVRNP